MLPGLKPHPVKFSGRQLSVLFAFFIEFHISLLTVKKSAVPLNLFQVIFRKPFCEIPGGKMLKSILVFESIQKQIDDKFMSYKIK